ncbi:asparaginase [Oleisolibacter albus]|uniref:asparaginase n=1 Tax=Oleisolibacter albus TaxID=2171757 RepID=UPI000DF17151|nr:asparaginase [Oleisolibacter albus]
MPHARDKNPSASGHVHDGSCGSGCCCGSGDGGADPARITLPDHRADPILVEVTRGPLIESVHRGRAVAVDAGGHVLASWGDIQAPVYPRSSNKSLQALPLVESGAADAFGLDDAELALACASHQGEPMHTTRVGAWLARLGLSAADLECGAHAPYHAPTWEAMLRRGEAFSALHNNCSGKHSGMLTTALHKGESLKGYVGYQHPVQQRILGVIEQMTGQDLSHAPWGVDGCSIPTIGVPLEALAYAMARMADPVDLPSRRAEAATRLVRAWSRHPELVAGSDAFDTLFMQALNSRIVVKSGAEGMCCAVVPEVGIGVALKIDDGTGRAAGPAMAAVLRALDLLTAAEGEAVQALAAPPISNRAGLTVGTLRGGPAF